MSDPLGAIDLTHEDVLVNGVRLHCVTAGPEDGEPVLLLHGFPEFWYSWRYQIPALVDAGYRVVAPDLRGYNRSEKPQGVDDYDIDALLGDAVGLVDEYGDERTDGDGRQAHVVAHDWGGGIAWTMGMYYPERIDRLVVMNSPHPAAFAREFDLAQLRRSWYILFFQVPWLPERLTTFGDSRAIAEAFRDQPTDPDAFDEDDIERYREAFGRPGVARAAINYYRAYFDSIAGRMAKTALPVVGRFFELPGDQEIPVETLVLWGEQDDALGVEISEGLDEWVPNVQVERFPEASHWVQCDAREAVTEELLAFL
jgi:pimeloyl-ACP methyl ester carboxylesterase